MEKSVEKYLSEMGGDLLLQVASQRKRGDDLERANGKLHEALVHAQELLDRAAAEIKDLQKQLSDLKGE